MSRKFAQWKVGLGNDAELMALSPEAFKLYAVLTTEEDLSAAGVVPWMDRRWAKWLGGRAAVDAAVDELVEARFLVVDEDTDEVLLRSFVRQDGRLGHRKWEPSVHRAVDNIRSDRLRDAVLAEIDRARETPGGLLCASDADSSEDTCDDSMPTGVAPTPNTKHLTLNQQQPPVDDPVPEAGPVDIRIVEAARLFGLSEAITSGARNPEGYSRSVVERLLAHDGEAARQWVVDHPSASAHSVAVNVFGLTKGQIDQVERHHGGAA